MIITIEAIIDIFKSFFSINIRIAGPKFPIKKATKKNLDPRVTKATITKYIKLK